MRIGIRSRALKSGVSYSYFHVRLKAGLSGSEKSGRKAAFFFYFIVGIENSAPARRPVGQRAVMVFMRV